MPEEEIVVALFGALMRNGLATFQEPLNAPKRRGVYVLYDENELVVHVGNTPRGKDGIAGRLGNHTKGISAFARKYKGLVGDADIERGAQIRDNYSFCYLVVDDEHFSVRQAARYRMLVQAYAAGHLCPAYIGLGVRP